MPNQITEQILNLLSSLKSHFPEYSIQEIIDEAVHTTNPSLMKQFERDPDWKLNDQMLLDSLANYARFRIIRE